MATSHHGSAPWIMHSLQLGEADADPVEVDRVLHLARDRRPGDAGVHAERQVELAALRVERVVDGVARAGTCRRPRSSADDGVGDRVVAHERLERRAAPRIGRSRLKPPTPRAKRSGRSPRSAVRGRRRRCRRCVSRIASLDAVGVHVVEQLARARGSVKKESPALEVVLLRRGSSTSGPSCRPMVDVHQAVDRRSSCVPSFAAALAGLGLSTLPVGEHRHDVTSPR